MSLHVHFHYAIDGLWVEQAVLGSTVTLTAVSGREWTLRAPEDGDSFAPLPVPPLQQQEWSLGEALKAEVTVVRLEALLPSDLDAKSYDGASRQEKDALNVALAEAHAESSTLLASMLTWTATTLGQTQFAPMARIIPQVLGPADIYDLDGDRIALSWHPTTTISWRGETQVLTQDHLDRLPLELKANDSAPAYRQLLAEAEYHAVHAQDQHDGLALVLAAVACEMAVKTTIRRLGASAEQAPLVELVLENPRDVSLAAASLFQQGLEAVGATSLKTANRPLNKAVATLFEHRNRFAHGKPLGLTRAEVLADITTARQALTFLEGILDDPDQPQSVDGDR